MPAMPAFRLLPFLFLSVPVLNPSACQPGAVSPLSGQIVLQPGWRPVLYLVEPRTFAEIAASYAGTVVDSAIIGPDGSFSFDGFQAPEEPALYELVIQPEGSRFANKLNDEDPETANYFPLVLQKGTATSLHADAGRLSASAAIKSKLIDNQEITWLRDIRQRAHDRFLRVPAGDAHADDTALLEQAARLEAFRAPLIAFADTTQSFWAAMQAVRWVAPDGDYERVPEFLARQCGRWQVSHTENPFTQQLCALANPQKLPVMVGDTIPDFALPASGGDTLRLHALLGKRLTVLDLWASWCAPCRRENREVLAPLWARYRSSGLAVVGYALDSSPETWKAAIRKDGAAWVQTSHLGGDASPFLDALRVKTIPANFLLDADGKVVAKNVHGEALQAFVDRFFAR